MQDGPVIVGVIRDAKRGDVRSNAPAAYLPFAQNPQLSATLTIRTHLEPAAFADAMRKVIDEVDPNLLLGGIWTHEQEMDAVLRRERSTARLAAGFGLLALTLACIGLYGFLSNAVARRTGEIGIRMALGAMPRQIVAMILRESLALVLVGVGTGLLAAAAMVRFVANLLYGLPPTDPVTYALVAAVLLAVAGLAAWLPARRATKVDPMVALRAE